MPLNRFITIGFLLALGCLHAQNPPPQYLVVDLGVLPGHAISSATSISESGLVGGFSSAGGNLTNNIDTAIGFVYSGNSLASLGSDIAFVAGVNSSAAVTGFSSGFPSQFSASLYQGGAYISVGDSVIPVGLNDAGQTVIDGFSYEDFSLFQPFIYDDGAITLLTVFFATGISGNGNVSGWDAPDYAYTGYQNGVFPQVQVGGSAISYEAPGGYPNGQAFAINNAGTAAGAVYTANFANAYAALFKGGGVNTLGTLPGTTSSFAVGINNAGWVVGFSGSNWAGEIIATSDNYSFPGQAAMPNDVFEWPLSQLYPPAPGYAAFLWISGKMYDLNSLVVNGTDWQLNYASAINDSGQIVGTGYHNGQQRAFLLTQMQPPAVSSVVGAGLSTPAVTTLTSGGLFTIFGTNFTAPGVTGSATAQNGVLQTSVANTCVQVGNEMAPLIYVSSTQINAVAPTLPASGDVTVSVIFDCGSANQTTSASVNVSVASASPEFLYLKQYANGQNPVAAVDSITNAYVGPAGVFSSTTTSPATAGEVLTIYATGLGDTTPAQTPGTLASSAATVNGTVTVTIGGVDAQVLYAGVSPGFAGLYQINLIVPQLPQSSLPGNQPIVISVDGVPSPAGAYLAVQ